MPENKFTDELASRRDLGLEPVVAGADEVQIWFAHQDEAIRREFSTICTDLVKRGPALGVWLILAAQRPSAKAIPAEISDNAIMRFAPKVQGQLANDMMLTITKMTVTGSVAYLQLYLTARRRGGQHWAAVDRLRAAGPDKSVGSVGKSPLRPRMPFGPRLCLPCCR